MLDYVFKFCNVVIFIIRFTVKFDFFNFYFYATCYLKTTTYRLLLTDCYYLHANERKEEREEMLKELRKKNIEIGKVRKELEKMKVSESAMELEEEESMMKI